MKSLRYFQNMRTGMWFLRGERLATALQQQQHTKLKEDSDKEQLHTEMNRKLSVGKRPISTTLTNSSVGGGSGSQSFITQDSAFASTTAVRHHSSNVSDATECYLGNMVISSYCCVVLVIFALLFILIGSILTYAVTQYSDVEVVQFINKHEYLRVASPLMICLGILMFIPGIIFWIAKRWCRRPRTNEFVNSSYTNSFFPPDVGPSTNSSQVSPLLQPLSGEVNESKGEWRWPANHNHQPPPAGSFPSSPKLNVLSPVTPECQPADLVSESNVDEVLTLNCANNGGGKV
ncbi:hypothetical protein CHUAL_002334 [Chamberlinius hualienensis]